MSDKILTALRAAEWAAGEGAYAGGHWCPSCNGERDGRAGFPAGHRSGCTMEAAIAEAEDVQARRGPADDLMLTFVAAVSLGEGVTAHQCVQLSARQILDAAQRIPPEWWPHVALPTVGTETRDVAQAAMSVVAEMVGRGFQPEMIRVHIPRAVELARVVFAETRRQVAGSRT